MEEELEIKTDGWILITCDKCRSTTSFDPVHHPVEYQICPVCNIPENGPLPL